MDELDAAWTDVSKAVDERDAALEEALDKSSKFQVSRIFVSYFIIFVPTMLTLAGWIISGPTLARGTGRP